MKTAFSIDWSAKVGKTVVDGDHYSYWSRRGSVYVRDGGDYSYSAVGPHFLDLGIMGKCADKCSYCYMRDRQTANMSVERAAKVVDGWKDTLCQVSLGGAGDPLQHEERQKFPQCLCSPVSALQDKYESPYTSMIFCTTINVAGKNVTDEQIQWMCGFEAVGLSCGEASSMRAGLGAVEDLLYRASKRNYNERPNFVLHIIVDRWASDVRRFAHLLSYPVVSGMLLLAYKKRDNQVRDVMDGVFCDRSAQKKFWNSVKATAHVLGKSVAVDSCLAPLLDPEIFAHGALFKMHPCDAGRFSAYVHADGALHLCSPSAQTVEDWKGATEAP